MVAISQIIIIGASLLASASAIPFNKIGSARGYTENSNYGGGYKQDYFPPCENSYSYEYGSDGYRYGYEHGQSCLILEDYCKVYHDAPKCHDYYQPPPPPPSKNGYLYSGVQNSGSYTPPATIVLKLESKSYNYNYWEANSIQVQTGSSAGCFGVDAGGNYRIQDIVSISEGFGVFFYTAEGCVRDTRIEDGKPPVSYAGPVSEAVNDSPVKSLRLVQI
ncbi:hypothetical protein HK098_005576 [Nowakowskiella sp. JEL0407]|nr:hypothetical protein HK098_005576 [Nowakowskiella sp. JEL0407]